MAATPYEPPVPSARVEFATVQAVNGGLVDLDFGGEEPVTGVACYGAPPQVGARVLVLLQGSGATVLAAAAAPTPPIQVYTGAILVAGQATGSYITQDVTFPAGRFSAAPRVVITPGSGRITPSVINITTNGCTFGFNNWSGNNSSQHWSQFIAINNP